MPLYMDTHDGTTDLPPELTRLVKERVTSGARDSAGVMDRGILIDKEGRKLHCILDAPDVDAVMRHHQMLNVPVEHESVHLADAILR